MSLRKGGVRLNSVNLVGKVLDEVNISKRGEYDVATTRIQVLTEYKNYDGQNPEINIPIVLWEPLQRHAPFNIKPGHYVAIRGHLNSFEYPVDDGSMRCRLEVFVNRITIIPN